MTYKWSSQKFRRFLLESGSIKLVKSFLMIFYGSNVMNNSTETSLVRAVKAKPLPLGTADYGSTRQETRECENINDLSKQVHRIFPALQQHSAVGVRTDRNSYSVWRFALGATCRPFRPYAADETLHLARIFITLQSVVLSFTANSLRSIICMPIFGFYLLFCKQVAKKHLSQNFRLSVTN